MTASDTRDQLTRGSAMQPSARATLRRRAGISATEMVVATGLATLLLLLLASAWANFGRPALEVEARARIEQEGILAAQSLACDLGGFLADTPGRTEKMQTGQSSSYQASSPPWDLSNPGVLLLNFYGAAPSDPHIVIAYQLQGNLLTRTNHSTGVATNVARYVTAFSAAADPDYPGQVVITLTIAYQNFTSTFTLIGVPPPS
jgi:Tfp pilus assembly protein PilW